MCGHVACHVRGVSPQTSKGWQQAQFTISESILAKLSPNCHMNYSINFTENSFYPETKLRPLVFVRVI